MKVKIEWTYKTINKQVITLTSEEISVEAALSISEDFERTGRTNELLFYDEKDTKWTKKELIRLSKELETEPSDIIVYFDGGYDNNNKQAGLGAVIYYSQNNKKYRLRSNALFSEIETNNEAEYAALWYLLGQVEELGIHHISVTFRGDSHVVLNQLSGDWPCFDEVYNTWLDKIEDKIRQLGIRPHYEPISRKQNGEADQLASQALEGIVIHSNVEI
ncbi:ribonuclease H family protein [Cytobacillus sp. IB215665]|uniref:ribonuclease H family protein n=1 Tax=Cytobacillus sp. IB215665 TaxID=3097357 RepID=UPI002A107958|nr:ribonuclease H family protein [Cytobacillus sp. IB215665]MDX8366514.1 ribonuclease H family protein [Cytobacillus sp. IB215665]